MAPPFLERRYSLCENIAAVASGMPDWSTYARADLLGQEHVSVLRAFSGKNEQEMLELMVKSDDMDGPLFAKAVSSVFESISEENTLAYTLNMTEDFLLADVTTRIEFFKSQNSEEYLVDPLVKLLNCSHEGVKGKASYLAALMLTRNPEPELKLKAVLNYIIEKLVNKEKQIGLAGGLLSLTVLLRNPTIRESFSKTSGLSLLFDVLRSHMGNMGMLYNITLCIWLCCFDTSVRQSVEAPELSVLIALLKSEPFEKVVRVTLAILRLMLQGSDNVKELSEALIGMGTLKVLDNLKTKKSLKDEDLLSDLKWLHDILEENFRVMTTFERHEKELATEHLSWTSSVHSDSFWKENALSFEKNDFKSLKKLISLLRSDDSTTAAIACYDIGQFVQYYPNGKLIVENLGGKKAIMMLLQHESPDVQKQALTACSKIMITNWRSVAK
mmetsp:Transcript_8994/g.10783  ORF Transcript_8994/g.10783 Transcript_8994/m.10783 type:complete len:443 (+) Transcript_8994:242-1570(+)|eukprot:CAMPEP_0184013088 /NCGR_PEP_ID=MMETSP0954-20121128/4814_1 /TAXON_ID=627963 /ORGANISM="Aplanochytrium sp, Strain PBS07" /LENGTH=442 /DNA_ID=CAMNT_0026293229 /DNA_START=201 /DNA_END=1529 /DNA_ORIENTATION=-